MFPTSDKERNKRAGINLLFYLLIFLGILQPEKVLAQFYVQVDQDITYCKITIQQNKVFITSNSKEPVSRDSVPPNQNAYESSFKVLGYNFPEILSGANYFDVTCVPEGYSIATTLPYSDSLIVCVCYSVSPNTGQIKLVKTKDFTSSFHEFTIAYPNTYPEIFKGLNYQDNFYFCGRMDTGYAISGSRTAVLFKVDASFQYLDTLVIPGCDNNFSRGAFGLVKGNDSDSFYVLSDRALCDGDNVQLLIKFDRWLNILNRIILPFDSYGYSDMQIRDDKLYLFNTKENDDWIPNVALNKYSLVSEAALADTSFGFPSAYEFSYFNCFDGIGNNEFYFSFTYADSSVFSPSQELSLTAFDIPVAIGRCDSNLNVNWFQIFGDTGRHWVTDLEVLPDSTLLAAGTVFRYDTATTWNRDLFLIHLNRDGTPVDSTSVGIEELHVPTATEAPVQAVPNPGSNGFWVESLKPGPFRLEVFSAAGRHLATRQNLRPGDFVSAAGWPQGVLLLRWQLPNGTWHTQRWLRQ